MKIEYNHNLQSYMAVQMKSDNAVVGTGDTYYEAITNCFKRLSSSA